MLLCMLKRTTELYLLSDTHLSSANTAADTLWSKTEAVTKLD